MLVSGGKTDPINKEVAAALGGRGGGRGGTHRTSKAISWHASLSAVIPFWRQAAVDPMNQTKFLSTGTMQGKTSTLSPDKIEDALAIIRKLAK